MAGIALMHGVSYQFCGEHLLLKDRSPTLQDRLQRAGSEIDTGDIFRPIGVNSAPLPPYTAADLDSALYEDLLTQMWDSAAMAEPDAIMPRNARTTGPTWNAVQQALNWCCQSKYFYGVMERALIFDLNQANEYLTNPAIRDQVQQRVAARISEETQVIVAHSLGTVVAYEALCANPDWPVHTRVTLRSPLGIRNFFFDRLKPAPGAGDIGSWPGSIQQWTNIADQSDLGALQKQLGPRFGNEVRDLLINNGARFHDATRYLTAKETGQAIAEGLSPWRG